MKDYWGVVQKASLVTSESQAKLYGCNVGDEIIIIPPERTILCHTNEFIGGRINITTMMKARSSMSRSCVSVVKCGGWGDIDYCNRWCMQIHNAGLTNLVLIVGQKVSQIVFLQSGLPCKSYTQDGSYQSSCNIAQIIIDWKPEDMLPKAKRISNRTFDLEKVIPALRKYSQLIPSYEDLLAEGFIDL